MGQHNAMPLPELLIGQPRVRWPLSGCGIVGAWDAPDGWVWATQVSTSTEDLAGEIRPTRLATSSHVENSTQILVIRPAQQVASHYYDCVGQIECGCRIADLVFHDPQFCLLHPYAQHGLEKVCSKRGVYQAVRRMA